MTAIVQKAGKKYLVPKGWSLVTIGDLFKVTRGKVLPMGLVSPESTGTDPYPVYSSQTKKKGLAGFYSEYLYEDAITWTTDGANAGDVNFRPGKFYCTNVCGVLLNTHGHANACVASILNSVTRGYVSYVGNPKLMNDVMATINIPIPPLAEQRKIAEILRTWDEAIETAEAELKAKQERKRWLMDKLLRLGAAGFSKSSASGWTAQRLGDILEIRHGKNQREVENPEGRYPILGTGGIIGRTNAFLYDKPSVLIGRKGTIDRPQYMDTPFWTIDTLFYTSISDRALPRFIFYVFCTINWQQYNAATGVPSLAASTIESIRIQLPPLAEQRKIADILQAVDADMEVINCRVESLRTQKRGLMQKLLTGEVLHAL